MFNLNMKKILKLFDSAQSLKTPQKYTTTNQINTRYVREEIKGDARPSCTGLFMPKLTKSAVKGLRKQLI